MYDPPPGVPKLRASYEQHTVPIWNLRPIARSLSLDAEGFRLFVHESRVRDFYDDEEARGTHYPEVEKRVAAATGAHRVVVFDHDSTEQGQARFVPHAAFQDPTAPHTAAPRESIELRCLVFY
jgi:hypothetical protein